MAYLPGFDNDVFISCTHKDNLGPGALPDAGWVTRFHLDLQQRLTEFLGVDACIWRDKKLRGSDAYSDEIFAQLKGSAVFIAILSPGYLRSTWCQNELEEFQKVALRSGGFEIGKVLRAVKVVKTPLAQGQHRDILSRCLGYEFFVQHPDSSHFEVLDPDEKDYKQRLSRLAQDIAHILRTIESAPAAKTSKATVYLAEPSSDLKDERQRVLDELVAQGYRVLPEAPLPEHVSDIRPEVEAALRQSALAIHLTGPRYGKRPEGTDESIVALQYELARRGGLQRLVWVATKPEETEAPQAAFLEALRTGLDQRADLLEHKTIEDLKDVILARLAPPAPEAVPLAEGDDLCRIYLICDQEDNPLDAPTRPALALRDFLFDAGFEVKLPVAGTTAAKSRQKDNRRKLEECDAVVLYWGLAPQTWIEEQLSGLKKALGWRRARPFSAKAIYVTTPEADEKRILQDPRGAGDRPVRPLRARAHRAVPGRPRARAALTVDGSDNPFPGLRPFEPHESALYFGRDDQIDELLERLAHARFLAVVGTSGSGKSSLVRAGLIPALQRGHLTGGGSRWRVAMFRPGDDPLGGLAQALGRPQDLIGKSSLGLVEAARTGEKLLVIVDQFEELFRVRQSGSEDSAAAFVKLLLRAAFEDGAAVFVVLTMRTDYLGACTVFRGLPEVLNGGQYLIPRMSRDQLTESIEGPIAVGGAAITPRLVQRLLNDVGDDPDQLPILQHALMRTWSNGSGARAEGRPLDVPIYEATGGMVAALNLHAEEAYKDVGKLPDGQRIARKLFQRLTEKGTDQQENRRPTSLAEICAVAEADERSVIDVIDRFRSEGRTFLNSPSGSELSADSVIDISHESLIRLWHRLRDWADEEALSAERYRRLSRAAELHARGEESLWRDPALQLALDWKDRERPNGHWAERYHPGFEDAMGFLDQSRKGREKRRRRGVVLTVALWLLTAGSVLATIYAAYGWRAAEEAQQNAAEQQTHAEAQKLAAQSDLVFKTSRRHLERSALLAIESMRRVPTVERDRALRQSLSLLPIPITRVTHENFVNTVAFSPDGRYFATGSDDRTARVVETATGKELSRVTHEDRVVGVAFSPDGRYLATGSDDKTARVVETTTGKELSRVTHQDIVRTVAFSPDGRYLATGSYDTTARVVETTTGKELIRVPHEGVVWAVAFSPDGRYLATGCLDKTARVVEFTTGKELLRVTHEGMVWAVAFSPDGRYLATGSADTTARVVETTTGKELIRVTHDHQVPNVAFSRDGRYLATGGLDNTARIVETTTGKELIRVTHEDQVSAVAFSPDGRHLATGSADTTARIVEATTGKELIRVPHESLVGAVAFSPDGRYLATGSHDKTARVVETTSGKELIRVTHEDLVDALAFSPDRRYLATGSRDKTARVVETTTGKELIRVTHEHAVSAVAFSPDGRYLATGSYDTTARVVETTTGKELIRVTHEHAVSAVAFSPDGRYLATGSLDKTARVVETTTNKEIIRVTHNDTVRALAFSPDGRYLATGSEDETARVVETTTGKDILRVTHEGAVYALVFSADDGRYLATGSGDETARAVETTTNKEIIRVTHEDAVAVAAVAFNADGRVLDTGTVNKKAATLPRHLLRAADLIAEACARLTRNLTPEEWKQYLGDTPYRKTYDHPGSMKEGR